MVHCATCRTRFVTPRRRGFSLLPRARTGWPNPLARIELFPLAGTGRATCYAASPHSQVSERPTAKPPLPHGESEVIKASTHASRDSPAFDMVSSPQRHALLWPRRPDLTFFSAPCLTSKTPGGPGAQGRKANRMPKPRACYFTQQAPRNATSTPIADGCLSVLHYPGGAGTGGMGTGGVGNGGCGGMGTGGVGNGAGVDFTSFR